MKNDRFMVIGLLLVTLTIIGCSNDSHPTYKISRKGVLIKEKKFDVIHVYGFVDNREIALQITTFLNKAEPDTYHYYEAKY